MSEDLREVRDEKTLEEARAAEVAILYKHSPRCPMSWSAKRQVGRFVEEKPEIPVYIIDVVQHRALSQRVAELLGVKHESPQAILLRFGEVVEHASHGRLTVQLLDEWVTANGR